jgi:hypothetical protein
MSSKQRRRNQKRARKAAESTSSVSGPSGHILKDHHDPTGQPIGDDQSNNESAHRPKNEAAAAPQEAVHHRASSDEQGAQVVAPNSPSVFSLSNRLSPDPDSVSPRGAAARPGQEEPRRRSRLTVSGWTLIATILGLLIGVPAFILAIREIRRHKALRVQYYAKAPLLTPEFSHAKEFRLTHRGRAVTDPYQLMITVRNTGTVTIKSDDVEEPIVFRFSKKVLEAAIVSKIPTAVNATCSNTEDRVTVNLGMFHSEEEFTVQVFCDGNPEWPNPTCRIDGVPRIEVVESSALPSNPG